VRLQGIGCVKVNQHRPVKGVVKTISIKREGRRWHLILSCDGVPAESLPSTGAVVGIDMRTTHQLLANKAENAGRLVLAVDARNTSRTCAACGHCAGQSRFGRVSAASRVDMSRTRM